MTTTIRFASQADRDAAMSTHMTDGMEMSYHLLDGVLASSKLVCFVGTTARKTVDR